MADFDKDAFEYWCNYKTEQKRLQELDDLKPRITIKQEVWDAANKGNDNKDKIINYLCNKLATLTQKDYETVLVETVAEVFPKSQTQDKT